MFGHRTARRLLAVVTTTVVGVVLVPTAAAAAPAAPPTLAGLWAPLNRCPVDDPAMLAADGVETAALCVASSASSGEIKLGNTVATSGGTDLQLGLLNNGGTVTAVAPPGGAIVGDPVQIPGGLLGLMCPSDIPLVSDLCDDLVGNPLNAVTATVESAGTPTDFDVSAGIGTGTPILTLPVKVHLRNPVLGDTCYIGSDENPIVLHPANTARPSARLVRFDADGTANQTGEMGYFVTSGTDQADTAFAVPGASGCGVLDLFGLVDAAVNLKTGLPSPAGNNSIVLHSPSTSLGGFSSPGSFAPSEGEQLAQRWHAAVVG